MIEQQKLAEILDTLDTAIHKTEAIIAKLRAVKQGLLHDLLTRGVGANGELRPPQDEAPYLYKESPLGWIPNEWSIRAGAEVCDEIVVGIVIRPTQYYRPEGIPVLRSANVRENQLSMNDLVFMDNKDHLVLSKSTVRPGDVLTVRTGYPGTSCVVGPNVEEANCVDILISRPGRNLDASYWSRWINSDRGKAQVLAAQGGLAQQHFNVGDLQKLLISLPPLYEQREIAKRLEALDILLDKEDDTRAGLINLKNGLADDLLTGRVRVTPLLEDAAP
jgi:type I restriction enzyme S subunit